MTLDPAPKPLSRWIDGLRLTAWFMRPYRLKSILSFLLIGGAAATEYLSIASVYSVMSQLTAASAAAPMELGRIFRFLNALSTRIPAPNPLAATALIVLVLYLAKAVFAFSATFYIEYLTQTIRIDIQKNLFGRYLEAPCSFFSRSRQGHLIFNTTQAPGLVASSISLLIQAGMSMITALAMLGLLFSLSFRVTLLLLLAGGWLLGLVSYVSKRIAYVEGDRANVSQSRLNVILNETITGFRVIKSYLIKPWVEEEFAQRSADFFRAKMRVTVYRQLLTELFTALIVVVFVIFVVAQSMRDQASLITLFPSLSVYMLALLRLSALMADLGRRALDYAHYMPNMFLLKHELSSSITEAEESGDIILDGVDTIEFRSVSFRYDAASVLSGVTFRVAKNQTVALVGESGGGKTTLLALLLKLYKPTEGVILINGIDIQKLNTESLRRQIVPVFQIPLLFNRTVEENVALTEASRIDKPALQRALSIAHATDLVSALQDGARTEIGDMGDRLSVGQKQRLLLARAFYRDPQVILLDEPTSALDRRSENLIIQTIRELSGHKTLLIVAHRLSTIEHADNIIVLKNGTIVEQGSHDILISQRGEYYKFHHTAEPAERSPH